MSLHKIIHIYLYIMICTHSFIMPTEITSLQETQLPETVDINDLVSKLSNFIPLPNKFSAIDFFAAENHLEQCRLARSVWTNHADNCASWNLEC